MAFRVASIAPRMLMLIEDENPSRISVDILAALREYAPISNYVDFHQITANRNSSGNYNRGRSVSLRIEDTRESKRMRVALAVDSLRR